MENIRYGRLDATDEEVIVGQSGASAPLYTDTSGWIPDGT